MVLAVFLTGSDILFALEMIQPVTVLNVIHCYLFALLMWSSISLWQVKWGK
jgi:hypothetical protein